MRRWRPCDACSSLQSETARFPQENRSILYIRLIMRHNLATEGGVLHSVLPPGSGALLTPPKLHVGRPLALNRQLSQLSRLPSRHVPAAITANRTSAVLPAVAIAQSVRAACIDTDPRYADTRRVCRAAVQQIGAATQFDVWAPSQI